MNDIVELKDLVVQFDVDRGMFSKNRKVHAVSGVSLVVRQGETFAIVGESGCGKSTLARALTRLLLPTAGDVRIKGRSVANITGAELRALHHDV